MKNNSYNRILYFIGFVIFITLMIQVYWNYRNYQVGKQQLVNEVQISLDNAVDEYYASNARFRTRLTLQNSTPNRGGNNGIFFIPDNPLFTIRHHKKIPQVQ